MIPFAFAVIKPFSRQTLYVLLYFFIMVIFAASAISFLYYLSDYQQINYSYKQAKVLPTPLDHIRFSLMIAFSVFTGIHLYLENFFLRYKWERTPLLLVVIFLFFFIHVLAVRSGLVVLYSVLSFYILRLLFLRGKRRAGIVSLVFLILSPVIAWFLFPTFQNKIKYMKYDMEMFYHRGEGNNLSDGGRIISIINGIEIGKNHVLGGVGAGDVMDEMNVLYLENYPAINPKNYLIPHNEYIFVFASTGVTGLTILLLSMVVPLIHRKRYKKNILLTGFTILVGISFLSEATIEGQIGTAFYITFLMLLINKDESANTNAWNYQLS